MAARNDAYTAYEHWEYEPMIAIGERKHWLDLAESHYFASEQLIAAVVKGPALEDVEGIAAVQLFRHYLELVLKQIVFQGRRLKPNGSIVEVEVGEVAKVHDLATLWKWVLEDAKPKIPKETWESFERSIIDHALRKKPKPPN